MKGLDVDDTSVEQFTIAKIFAATLFDGYSSIEGANNAELRQLLIATVFMNVPKFLVLLSEHPEAEDTFGNGEAQYFSTHTFLKKIMEAAHLADIAGERADDEAIILKLKEWSSCIGVDFIERNFMRFGIATGPHSQGTAR